MFVSSLSVGWLKCTFHCNISYVIIFSLRTAKVGIFLIVPKKIAKLSSVNSKFVTTKLESCRILLQKGHEKIYSDICFIEIDY